MFCYVEWSCTSLHSEDWIHCIRLAGRLQGTRVKRGSCAGMLSNHEQWPSCSVDHARTWSSLSFVAATLRLSTRIAYLLDQIVQQGCPGAPCSVFAIEATMREGGVSSEIRDTLLGRPGCSEHLNLSLAPAEEHMLQLFPGNVQA